MKKVEMKTKTKIALSMVAGGLAGAGVYLPKEKIGDDVQVIW